MLEADILVGPTASGKSAVAQVLAERLGRRIVSADSMNVYRGMDIGTAKPSADDRSRVKYAGVDLVNPEESFNVAVYLDKVRPAFVPDDPPIVAGGTGLYAKCLTQGFDSVPPENRALRDELKQLDSETLAMRARSEAAELYAGLTEDDRNNPRRLIRILEKALSGGGPVFRWRDEPRPTLVGLRVERSLLLERIESRVDNMYAAGLLDEARGLLDRTLSATAAQAIGYAEAFAVLRSEMSINEAREQTVIRTRRLAKRQMTWFRNQLDVEWVDCREGMSVEEAADEVLARWRQVGKTPVVI